jgi:DNA-binding transcriptional LysR family regulator
MLMDLRQLEYFHHAALLGSFTHAAERLHVTQSALSQGIKLLEVRLKRPLFVRGRKVQLTPDGRRLMEYTGRVLNLIEEMTGEWDPRSARLRGTVRAAVLYSALTHVLPPVIARFAAAHPEVDFDFVRADPQTAEDLVKRGDVSFAVTPSWPRDPALEVRTLANHPFVLARAARSKHRTIAKALAHGPLILLGSWQEEVLRNQTGFFDRHRASRIQYATNCVVVARQLVAADVGPGVIPRYAVGPDLKVIEDVPKHALSLHLVRRRDRIRSPVAEAFMLALC